MESRGAFGFRPLGARHFTHPHVVASTAPARTQRRCQLDHKSSAYTLLLLAARVAESG